MKPEFKTRFKTGFENGLITSFRLCYTWLGKAKSNPYEWKWVIIFFHNAVQNLMVKELGEDIQLILKPGVSQDLLKSIQLQKKMTRRWEMDYFMELVKKVGKIQRYTHSQPFTMTQLQLGCMKYLNAFRNKMIHFTDHSFSEDVALFPRIILFGVEIPEFAINKSGNILWYEKENEATVSNLIKKIRRRLERLDKLYALPFEGIPKNIEETFNTI